MSDARSRGEAFVAAEVGACTCLPAYKDRGLADPQCAWCDHGEALAAYVRDLETALARAEGERDEAKGSERFSAQVSAQRERVAIELIGRVTRLATALERLAGHHHAVTHPGRFETCSTSICREAREALSPPGPTQGAPAAEPARADIERKGRA